MDSPAKLTRHAAWGMAKRYWTSEEKKSAWALLICVIVLSLVSVYVSVRMNRWHRDFFNAFQQFDTRAIFYQIGVFSILLICFVGASGSALYLGQSLQIRWRRWLTRRYLLSWLADRTYYKLKQDPLRTTDVPIKDLNRFTEYVVTFSVGLIPSFVSLVSFLAILWRMSRAAAIPLGALGTVQIPGYLFWAALVFSGIGTWLAVTLSRSLVDLNKDRQRYDNRFSSSLGRLGEHAESIALHGGEPAEFANFDAMFQPVYLNFRQIMRLQFRLNVFTLSYEQVAFIFPAIVTSPLYFARQIRLGGLMQAVNAFLNVHKALSFFINSYNERASWEALTQRLAEFGERLESIHASVRAPQSISIRRKGTGGVAVDHLDLDLPDGTPLLRAVTFTVERGGSLLIVGPSGSGKTTLLRAIAGIWPFGRGRIRLTKGPIAFVPQRPYLPLGTLADAVLYPRYQKVSLPVELPQVLERVGLDRLIDDLDKVENWSERLSLGEQQGLAFARILLSKPALVFLDEASSALDDGAKKRMFGLLRDAIWQPTIVSVGHGEIMRRYHPTSIDLAEFRATDVTPPAE
jgi:putative ATP-binding cassette transporter